MYVWYWDLKIVYNVSEFLFELSVYFCFFFSAFPKEEPPDVCPEEPHLCICNGLHYKRHAHCSQSDAAKRHGIAFHPEH